MSDPKYFFYTKGASYSQQFDCWKKIFENTFRNDKGADDLFHFENEEFIDCAISDKHIALLTKDGRVCRMIYKVCQKKSKHDNSPKTGEKNKDRKRPRFSTDVSEGTAAPAESRSALAIQRQTLLANDINPDEALELRNSLTNPAIPNQLRRLRGISRNIIPDSLIDRIQHDFPQVPRDMIAVALAQNNLTLDDTVVALSRQTSQTPTNPRFYVDPTTPRVVDNPLLSTNPLSNPPRSFNPGYLLRQIAIPQPYHYNASEDNRTLNIASNIVPDHNVSVEMAPLGSNRRILSYHDNTSWLPLRSLRENPNIHSRTSPYRLECEVDLCVEVSSTIWWSMNNDVKIQRIFAMRSDLVMLDELGGLHQWNWRKLCPLMSTKNKQVASWGFHSHTRLLELGVTEPVVHVDASPLRLCFSTNTNQVYTFLDRCIPFLRELNHKVPMPSSTPFDPIKRISVCNSYAIILTENGQAFFWGLKSMPMMLPLQFTYLNELKIKDRNKSNNFYVGSKVYNFRCPLHREGSLVVDVSNDTVRFGRITSDITEFPQNVVVEVVKDYRDLGSFGMLPKFSKPTKRTRSLISHSCNPITTIDSKHAINYNTTCPNTSASNTNTSYSAGVGASGLEGSKVDQQQRTVETWRIDNVIFFDDMLDNCYRYELGVVVKVEKNNLIVCTEADLIDKPYKEIAAKANVASLSVWKISDTHIFNEKNASEIMTYIKYKIPSEPIKVNSAVTGHKILAISASQCNILSVVERSNGEVTGAVFEYKGKSFREIEFNLPDSIRLGLMNGDFTVTHMKHFGDLIVLTTNDGGETIFRRCNNKSRVLDAPAFPLISAIRMFSHHRSSFKLNKHFNLCLLLPRYCSIFKNNCERKYAPERLLQHSLFYQRQNILHVMAYEALYFGYKHNGVNSEKELAIAQHVRTFVRSTQYQQTIINLLHSCDINGFTPIIYAISIRSYHVAFVYVEFVLDMLLDRIQLVPPSCQPPSSINSTEADGVFSLDETRFNNTIISELKGKLLRTIFPHKTYTPNNSVYYMLCANDVCSFTFSGPKHIKQDIYQCYTCSLSGKLCCCSQCASVCHYGHNCLLMGASPTAYCDCWEISHCKCLIGGDQDMRLCLFKLLVDNVDLFGSSCIERWDILVAFLLYTESRPDYSQKTDLSSKATHNTSTTTTHHSRTTTASRNIFEGASNSGNSANVGNSNRSSNFILPLMPVLPRKDPLSSDTVATNDLGRIFQRGLVHGFQIRSVVAKFDFIIAALEIIFSNVSLVKKILTPRELVDDNPNLGGVHLISEYSQHSAYQTLEEEIGSGQKHRDVRYVDSTVCYLIFKCKSSPLNRLIASLKNDQVYTTAHSPTASSADSIIDVFIRSVCRVFNVFICGMSPGLYKSASIGKYLNTFYDLFAIDPASSVTTLITMANAVITPVIMNITGFLHNVNLADNETDCIEKTVKMFILHPRISKNVTHSEALINRGNLVEVTIEPPSVSSEDTEDEIDSTDETTSSDDDTEDLTSEDDDDVSAEGLDNVDTEFIDSINSALLNYDEHEAGSYENRTSGPYVISHDVDDIDDYSSYSDEESSDQSIDEEEDEYSPSTSSSEEAGVDLDDISENSDVSHLFGVEDPIAMGGEFLDPLTRFNQLGTGSRMSNINRSVNVIFNRGAVLNEQPPLINNNANANIDPGALFHTSNPQNNRADNLNFSQNDQLSIDNGNPFNTNDFLVEPLPNELFHSNDNNNRLVASLDWSINNSANRVFGPAGRDLMGRHSQIPEGHPRVISTMFNETQQTRPNISFSTSRNPGSAVATNSILASNFSYPTVLSSNEASSRAFASLLRTVTIIMKQSNMFNDNNFSNVIHLLRNSLEYVTTWLFRIMDYTEALLRHGVTTNYRLPKLMKNEMAFLVQNYQQLHDTTNLSWNYFRRNSAIALGEGQDEDEYSSNSRMNFLSVLLSLSRSSNDEHLYMMPKVDTSSMRYVAYIFDAFVYYMKEEKLSVANNFDSSNDNNNSDDQVVVIPDYCTENDAQFTSKSDVARSTVRFFKRTDSTLMLASLVPDELTTPLSEALPFAKNPTLLTPTSSKQDLFGFSFNLNGSSSSQIHVHGRHSSSRNPYSTNLFQYNRDNISGNLFDWDLVELYSRWNCCVTSFAKLFLKDVGAEPGSSLLEIGHYDTKIRSFKRLLNRSMYKSFKEYTIKGMPRDFEEILPITFEKLNTIFRLSKPNGNEKIPRIIATFKNEPGEGQGVTRNFVNDVFLAIISLKKLPDLKNVFLNARSYLDFSLMDDIDSFLDSCVLCPTVSSRLPSYSISTSQTFNESNTTLTNAQRSIGRCILNYLTRKNVRMAELVTGIIISFPYEMLIKCVTNHHMLFNYVREIQADLEVPIGERSSKQQLYMNEEIKFDDNEALFQETSIKGQYIPMPGKRSRERTNAFINVGRLIGQCIVLDVPCPLVLVRPVVKYMLGREISWHDFAFYDGALYESMRKMIIDAAAFEDRDEHLYDLYFATEKIVSGKLETFDLIPGGRDIIVTPRNVLFYVKQFCHFQMVHSVKLELEAMKRGLNQVIPFELFETMTAEDFKLLVNGCTFVTVDMLKKVTNFVVEASNVPQARIDQFKSWFWSVCNELTQQQRSELLTFWTSSPNLSADYLSPKHSNPTVVIKYLDDFRLPTANTCSTKLFVPLYSTKKILKTQLLSAIKCRTFGFV